MTKRLINKKFKEPLKRDGNTYIPGGYVEKELSYYGFQKFKKNARKFNELQFAAFKKIINRLKEKNIQLILIQPPTPKAFYSSFTDNAYFDKRMNELGEYYNFNSIVNLNDSLHFYDPFHLNKNGVALFNNRLIELLHEKGN